MWRTILSIIAGLVAWACVATLLNFGLRLGLPGYTQAEPAMAYTLAMKIARLLLAAVSCLAACAVVRAIAPASRAAPWAVGLILLALFLPVHIQLWTKFPIWYHLTFLVSLAPLVVLGAAALRRQ
jgi:hypothetical protein